MRGGLLLTWALAWPAQALAQPGPAFPSADLPATAIPSLDELAQGDSTVDRQGAVTGTDLRDLNPELAGSPAVNPAFPAMDPAIPAMNTGAAVGALASSRPRASQSADPSEVRSHPEAQRLLAHVLDLLINGPAFDAKVRETVWTAGREVIGVGTYEQAGGGTGRFHLQITMHDGDGKHRLQQISDGRLAWTRTEISEQVSLRRVDVGRLDEWVRGATESMAISPGLLVGGWAEMLSTIERDYVLGLTKARLRDEPVLVITGDLRADRRQQILDRSKRSDWAELHPTRVLVALQARPDPETGFGQWLPIRMEFWSDPIRAKPNLQAPAGGRGRLITLVELYSIAPIAPPPHEHFRFENQDAEVNFLNETDRYIERYGVELTQRERRQLRR